MTHSFPTRRSSDLDGRLGQERGQRRQGDDAGRRQWRLRQGGGPPNGWQQIRHGRARPALRNAGERRRGGRTERGSAGRIPRFIGGPFAVTAIILSGREPFRRLPQHQKFRRIPWARSEEHTSELQSLMRISYAVFCLKKKNT